MRSDLPGVKVPLTALQPRDVKVRCSLVQASRCQSEAMEEMLELWLSQMVDLMLRSVYSRDLVLITSLNVAAIRHRELC